MPASPPSAERRRGDAGYTMIEMIVVIAIAGTLMAAAVSGWQTWSRAAGQDGLVTELRGVLRQAQQRAVTTGTSTCVLFDVAAASWSIYRGRCDDDAKVRLEGPIEADAGLLLSDPALPARRVGVPARGQLRSPGHRDTGTGDDRARRRRPRGGRERGGADRSCHHALSRTPGSPSSRWSSRSGS